MKTFNLEEATQFLNMSTGGLRRLAANKKILAAKPGRGWCFLEEDLVNYVRSLYDKPYNQISQGVYKNRRKTWHSTRKIKPGGLILRTTVRDYKNQLGVPIR